MNKELGMRRSAVIGLSVVALSMLAVSAQANNLVTNGEFSLFAPSCLGAPAGASNQVLGVINFSGACVGPGAVLQGWTNNRGFTAVYGANAAELIGAGPLFLWGPKNGSPTNFDDISPNQISNPTASPPINFLASDSDPSFNGTFFQTITGLVPGQQYLLSYFWAAAQFTLGTGATDSGWTVTLGNQMLVDGTIGTGLFAHIDSKGFSGWNHESVSFTYVGGPTSLLSFLAVGNPSGLPPVALLDSVSLTAVPEPASLSLLGVGLLGLVFVVLRRRTKAVVT